jgi:hypothetical protein
VLAVVNIRRIAEVKDKKNFTLDYFVLGGAVMHPNNQAMADN